MERLPGLVLLLGGLPQKHSCVQTILGCSTVGWVV
jgi:hypothetical protein